MFVYLGKQVNSTDELIKKRDENTNQETVVSSSINNNSLEISANQNTDMIPNFFEEASKSKIFVSPSLKEKIETVRLEIFNQKKQEIKSENISNYFDEASSYKNKY